MAKHDDIEITKENQVRRLKQAQMQRQVKRQKRRLQKIRAWLQFAIVVIVLLASYGLVKMPQWYLAPDAFDKTSSQSLEIINNRIVPAYKVLSALRCNPVPQEPIFMVNTEHLKESIMHLEPVQDVYIRRFWFPARLQIIIIERTPILTISPSAEVAPIAFFSTDGKLIGREYMPLDESYKTWLILTYGTKDDYRNWDESKVRLFRTLAQTIEDLSGEKVEYIDYRNPDDIYVKISTVSIRIGKFSTTKKECVTLFP